MEDINALAAEALGDSSAMLIDVRTPDEYAAGHIPGSLNVPLENIRAVWKTGADEDTPLFLYCAYGSRAARVGDAAAGAGLRPGDGHRRH